MSKWDKLNAENSLTTDAKLTRAVQHVIDMTDESTKDKVFILKAVFGDDKFDAVVELFGLPERVMGVAYIDDRPVMLGDCPCHGQHCRAAWGWEYKATDLSWTGHAGHEWMEPCASMPCTDFDPLTGESSPPPQYTMSKENLYRFRRKEWGDVDKEDLAMFMSANLAISEGRETKDWKVD